MLVLNNIKKTYNDGKPNAFNALNGISLTVGDGESVAIVGQSGAGKTTLLNILRGQLKITSGEVNIDAIDMSKLAFNELAIFRRNNICNVYQDYFLIDELTVFDNVELALSVMRISKKQRYEKCIEAIKRVGLADMYNKKVFELSGGEKQRTAIARAIVTNAKYIMADEPTGALDIKNSENIMNILFELNAEGRTLIFVTHELSLAKRAKRIITISDGLVVDDESEVLISQNDTKISSIISN